ncbi:coil containing protein [Vibrio phage 1.081.O._10N.286.52.C2]|nr:coil containing protein [Vibrio phage 1.081.O._10N.286.52.C2]
MLSSTEYVKMFTQTQEKDALQKAKMNPDSTIRLINKLEHDLKVCIDRANENAPMLIEYMIAIKDESPTFKKLDFSGWGNNHEISNIEVTVSDDTFLITYDSEYTGRHSEGTVEYYSMVVPFEAIDDREKHVLRRNFEFVTEQAADIDADIIDISNKLTELNTKRDKLREDYGI